MNCTEQQYLVIRALTRVEMIERLLKGLQPIPGAIEAKTIESVRATAELWRRHLFERIRIEK